MASKVGKSIVAGLVLLATVAVFVEPASAAGGTMKDPGPAYDEIDTNVTFDGSPDPHTGLDRKIEIEGGDEPIDCAHGDPDDGEIGTPPPPDETWPSGGCFTAHIKLNNVANGVLRLTGASGGGHPSGVEILGATSFPSTDFNIFGSKAEMNEALKTLTFDPDPDYETSYPPSSGDPTFITLTIFDGNQDKIAFVDGEGAVIDPDQITLDVRIEQPNDPPNLSIGVQGQPIQVPAGGEAVLRNGDGVDEFADDVFLEDPDVDDDEDDDLMLMVAWLDGGGGQADFSLSPSVTPECVTSLEEILAQDDAEDPLEPIGDHCDVLPGPIALDLVPTDLPGSLSFTSSTQDQQAIALLGRYEEANNSGPAQAILSYIEFDAMPTGDCDCTITVVVSDLGNNGLPLPNVTKGVVLPFPGFDIETIDFQVRDPENDPPVVTPIPPGPTPVEELASVPVSFSVEDSDAGEGELTITNISVSGGTLAGAPSVPMNGSQTALTAALTGMTFTASESAADPGVGSVTVTVQDNGRGPAEDPADNQTGSGTATFTINEDGNPDSDPNPGVNDPPELSAPPTIAAVEGTPFDVDPVTIGVLDPDAATDDLTLTITTTGEGTTDVEGDHTGTLTELNTVLDGLTFTPDDDPDFADGVASIQIDVNDNGHNPDSDAPADEGTDSVTIGVTIDDDDEPPEVNDPPELSAPLTVAADEGTPFDVDPATIGVLDPDAGTDDLTLTITTTGEGTTDVEGDHTGTLTELNTVLDGLTFTPDDDPDFADGVASIQIDVNDNGHNPDSDDPADEGTDSVTIGVTIDDDDVEPPEVNDPPVITAPASGTVDEGIPAGFDSATIGVDDPDAGADDLTMTITPTGGTTNADGVTTGDLTELNAILDALEFTAPQDPDFADGVGSIVISVNDDGHNPDSDDPADEGTDTATVELTINDDDIEPPEVNDPPVLTAPSSIDVTEGLSFGFNPAAIGVDDPDAGADDLTMTITTTGEGVTNAEGVHTGTLAELEAVLDALSFQTVQDADTVDDVASILIEVNDNGHNPDSDDPTEEGTDAATIDVAITDDDVPPDPNDPPTLTAPGAQIVEVGGSLAFTGGLRIVVDDPDAGSADLVLHLEVTGGTLAPATTDITGDLAELQAFLDSLVFTAGTTLGAGSVTVTVDDQGNTGTGGALTASATIDLTIIEGDDPPEETTTTTTTTPGSSTTTTTPGSTTTTPGSTTTTDPSVAANSVTTGSTTSATTGSLPRTGPAVTALVVLGSALLLVGAVLVAAVRRRRSSS